MGALHQAAVARISLPMRYWPKEDCLVNGDWADIEAYCPGDRIRQMELASIRAFMEQNRGLLKGRVLDFGAGRQPYRDLVDGEYVPVDKGQGYEGTFDAIMCNQVLQYVANPKLVLLTFAAALRPGGRLVMTYPTSWDEVEGDDWWRFTKAGMEVYLRVAGFTINVHQRRAEVGIANFTFPLGYGVVCTRA